MNKVALTFFIFLFVILPAILFVLWTRISKLPTIDQALPLHIASDSLPISVKPFIDLVQPQQKLLFIKKKQNETSSQYWNDVFKKTILVNSHPLISLEFNHDSQDKNQTWIYNVSWKNKHGQPVQEWLKKDLFTWPLNGHVSFIKDVFTGIPVPPRAKGLIIDLTYYKSPNYPLINELKVYGHSLKRYSLANFIKNKKHMFNDNDRNTYVFSFPALNKKKTRLPIADAGLQINIENVIELYVPKADHSFFKLKPNQSWTLGSFLPHSIIIKDPKGALKNITINNASILKLQLINNVLHLDAYYYHFAESYQMALGERPQYSYELGKRYAKRTHHNIALVDELLETSMEISYGSVPSFLIPLWQPQGRLSTYIFAEHADYQEAETDVLFMYGNSQKQLRLGEGFIGNKIPLTKTIFLLGDDYSFTKKIQTKNNKLVDITFTQPSYEKNSKFAALIDHYKNTGVEIELGAHTVATTTRKVKDVRKALAILQNLKGRVWIDHGETQEMLMRSGLDRRDNDYFILPSLKEFGIKYVNALNEIFPKRNKFKQGSNMIYDNAPSNLIYSIPGYSNYNNTDNDLYFFSTLDNLNFDDVFSNNKLAMFVKQRGVGIFHCYLADSLIDFSLSPQGIRQMQLKPSLQAGLKNLAYFRDRGDIHLSTVGNWVDFVTSVRKIAIYPKSRGFEIYNPGKLIHDMSFAILPLANIPIKNIYVDGVKISNTRLFENVFYFWLDIPKGKHFIYYETA